MAIDFGGKRLGIAVSDVSATLAQPVTVIDRSRAQDYIAALAKLFKDYDVERIVIGYPRTLAGEAGPQAAVVDEFIKTLQGAFRLPVDRYDERLSSKEALTWLAQMGIRGRKARQAVDKVAAALILQSYLDREARPRRA
jgi:putative Holliday junction resolvase